MVERAARPVPVSKTMDIIEATPKDAGRIMALISECTKDMEASGIWFLSILHEGTGKEFDMEDNARWLEVTRPILEAFFHARFFLEMAVKYGRDLKYPPKMLPSGWASFLYLYNLR